MNIDINETQLAFDTTLKKFKADWRNGELTNFWDVEEYLDNPLDDEELELFINCVNEILMRRAAAIEKAIELCKRYRVINPKTKEENDNERR